MKQKLKHLKSIVLASMVLVSFFASPHAFAQVERAVCPPPFGEAGFFQLNDEGKIELSVAFEATGLTKDELFLNAKSWYLELLTGGINRGRVNEKIPRAVLTIDDKELGQLVSMWVPSPYYDSSRIPDPRFTLEIQVRDGQSEISISDVVVYYSFLIASTPYVDPLSAEKFFNVNKPHKRYSKKTGNMVKVRRLECEDLIEFGSKIIQSYSEAIEHKKTAEAE